MEPLLDFDALGWLQFEQLCEWAVRTLADADDISWSGSADTVRSALVDADLDCTPLAAGHLITPTVIGIAWATGQADRRRLLIAQAGGDVWRKLDGEGSAILFTNSRVPVSWELAQRWPGLVVIDGARLTEIVRGEPNVRLRAPSVLGLAPPSGRLVRDLPKPSTLDLEAAKEVARVFVPTRAYHRAVSVLERHRFVVLTGPPEMGKTAIARTIGLAQLTTGWEVHECLRPDDLWRVFDAGRAQAFIADDAFGSTEYRPDAAEHWARELPRILQRTDDRHWLIWTSRPAPLRAGLHRVHQERGAERFPSPGQVQVEAGDLDVDEKASILLRHARASAPAESTKNVLRAEGVRIVDHPHFTPERIRRLVANRLAGRSKGMSHRELEEAVRSELEHPTEAMAASLDALSDEHRALLIAMLDCPAGPIPERELARSMRRHHPNGLSAAPAQLVDRLTDHFLRVTA